MVPNVSNFFKVKDSDPYFHSGRLRIRNTDATQVDCLLIRVRIKDGRHLFCSIPPSASPSFFWFPLNGCLLVFTLPVCLDYTRQYQLFISDLI